MGNSLITEDTHVIYLDLPGQDVRNIDHVGAKHIAFVVKMWRDVLVRIKLPNNPRITLESTESNLYSKKDNKLFKAKEKINITNGQQMNFWIARTFKGHLELRVNDGLVASFQPNALDHKQYDNDPKTKPEPFTIAIGMTDPAKADMSRWMLNRTNTHYDPQYWQKGMWDSSPFLEELQETIARTYAALPRFDEIDYMAATMLKAESMPASILQKLKTASEIEMDGEEFLNSLLPRSIRSDSDFAQRTRQFLNVLTLFLSEDLEKSVLNNNAFKETAGYLQSNLANVFKHFFFTVRIETAHHGHHKIILKGPKLVFKNGWFALGKQTKSYRLNHAAVEFITQGHSRQGGRGILKGLWGPAGNKRLSAQLFKNAKAGAKIQVIGTIIDITLDAVKVFGKDGSNDWSEFIGRAGVSVAKAAITAVVGGLLASLVVGIVGTAALPAIVVVTVVVASYVLVAYIIDGVDSSLQVKERVANAVR